jgi:hypothetical protein
MINGVDSSISGLSHNTPVTAKKGSISADQVKEEYLHDSYKQMSERDVPMMKGDCGPRIKTSYERWDKDLQVWDKREAGSLPLQRRNTKCGTLAKKYREFQHLPYDMTLGAVRNIYGEIGIAALRQAIRGSEA